jgi:hypothetical protein
MTQGARSASGTTAQRPLLEPPRIRVESSHVTAGETIVGDVTGCADPIRVELLRIERAVGRRLRPYAVSMRAPVGTYVSPHRPTSNPSAVSHEAEPPDANPNRKANHARSTT